jgi:hypothetical protein
VSDRFSKLPNSQFVNFFFHFLSLISHQGILQLFSQFNFGELEHNRSLFLPLFVLFIHVFCSLFHLALLLLTGSPATSMRTRNIAIAATAAPDELIDSITPPAEPTNDQLVIPIPHAVPNS